MRPWLAALLALWLAVAAAAQERLVVHQDGERQVCTVRMLSVAGSRQGLGSGFLLVDLQNHDDRPHTVALQCSTPEWSEADLRAERTVALGPQERTRFHLPVLNGDYGLLRLRLQIDGAVYRQDLQGPQHDGPVALFVTERADLRPRALELFQLLPNRTSDPPDLAVCSALDLPADWRWYTGFRAVLIDGRTLLGAETQAALRRFAHAGGLVVVVTPDRLPAGDLRQLLDGAGPGDVVGHGFGSLVALPGFGEDTMPARTAFAEGGPPASWPVGGDDLLPLVVPGLGEAPVLVFLALILGFALAVGPVNFYVVKRLRRPLLTLLTVPALGFGTTALILGYGFLHDGLGAQGALRSFTVLDQGRHEAAALALRTVFTGLAPRQLELGADSLLLSPLAHGQYGRRTAHRWHFDAERGVLDGGALASRIVTPMLTAQQGVARQRLRAAPAADGGLDLLVDGGVQPVGEVLLRGPDGTYYLGQAPRLRLVSAEQADAALGRFRDQTMMVMVQDPDDIEVVHQRSLAHLQQAFLFRQGLPNGSYLCRVAAPPWLPDHGLRADYTAAHFVFGTLGAEDFGR